MRRIYIRQKLIVILFCWPPFTGRSSALYFFLLLVFLFFTFYYCYSFYFLFLFPLMRLFFIYYCFPLMRFLLFCFVFLLWGFYSFCYILFYYCWVINSVWQHDQSLVLLNLVCSKSSCHPFTSSWSWSLWTIFPLFLISDHGVLLL